MEVKPGYKLTEVGVIPEDWDVSTIETFVDEISMGPFGSDITVSNFVSSGVPVLNGTNVAQERLLDSFENFVTPVKARSLKKAVARRGDIVVTHRGTIGQIAYIPDDSEFEKYVISQSQFRVRFLRKVLPFWVVSYFHSEIGSKKLLEGKGHTGVPAIAQPTKTFRSLSLPVPPLPEQYAIAAALSDTDALLDGLDRLIAKKRAIKQAAMQQLLTGKTRLPGFGGEWEVRRLGDFGVCYRGVSYNPNIDLYSCDTSDSVRLLRANNVQESSIILNGIQYVSKQRVSESQYLCTSDVLICMANGSKELVGKSAQIDLDDQHQYTFGAFMGCYRPNASLIDTSFVFYLFQTEIYRRQLDVLLSGSSINNLSPLNIEGLGVYVPVQREEQTAIATLLSDMDAEITALETRRAKTRALKLAMMQELLTGRTRLLEPGAKPVEGVAAQTEGRKGFVPEGST